MKDTGRGGQRTYPGELIGRAFFCGPHASLPKTSQPLLTAVPYTAPLALQFVYRCDPARLADFTQVSLDNRRGASALASRIPKKTTGGRDLQFGVTPGFRFNVKCNLSEEPTNEKSDILLPVEKYGLLE
jgi:hypothetical protein